MADLKLPGWKLHQTITILLKVVLIIGASLALYQGRIQVAAESIMILLITFLPLLLGHRFQVRIPPEFELLAILFVFASLFLGEVHDYYTRYWWWDLVLHAGAGLLLGILGFLLVYVLNEKENVHVSLTPGFMGFFAFTFAMAFGALWEIFEFMMDQLFGLSMQKPMFGDLSGLTDTMWDLIIDGVGAMIISILGYGYLRTRQNDSFLERWINEFIRKNPGLFSKDHEE
jgi:hypothetical protein